MNNLERFKHVQSQIAVRLTTLQGWTIEGIPPTKELPRSLNQVRCWEDPDLGISKIGSPGSFTTKHPEHGAAVKEIAALLEVLIKRQRESEPDEPSLATLLRDERKRSTDLKKMLEDSADLYVAITVALEETQRDLRVTRQSLESVTARHSESKQQIKELHRRLAQYSTSELVTDLHPRRSS